MECWFRYPIWALSNLRINAWILNKIYSFKVKITKEYLRGNIFSRRSALEWDQCLIRRLTKRTSVLSIKHFSGLLDGFKSTNYYTELLLSGIMQNDDSDKSYEPEGNKTFKKLLKNEFLPFFIYIFNFFFTVPLRIQECHCKSSIAILGQLKLRLQSL